MKEPHRPTATRSIPVTDWQHQSNPASKKPAAGEECHGFEIWFTVKSIIQYRLRFEPRTDGPGWWKQRDEWTGCTWQARDRTPVTEIEPRILVKTAREDTDD
jgi:hypothetical protein